jgi:hypothetical protein
MSFLDDVICPISNVKVDNNISRLTVFFNVILLALFLTTQIPYFVILCAADYAIRVAGKPQYSPMRWLAAKIASALKWPVMLKDQAPKIFAARLGLLFSASSVIFFPFSLPVSLTFASILLVFATLDSVFNFCVGCLTYTYGVLPFYKWRGIRN